MFIFLYTYFVVETAKMYCWVSGWSKLNVLGKLA